MSVQIRIDKIIRLKLKKLIDELSNERNIDFDYSSVIDLLITDFKSKKEKFSS